jgi:hypothetical protein
MSKSSARRLSISNCTVTMPLMKARDMVRTMRERGDNDGADTWLRIIVAIETIRRRIDGDLPQ